jgi:hypothetical protein
MKLFITVYIQSFIIFLQCLPVIAFMIVTKHRNQLYLLLILLLLEKVIE